MEPQRGGRNDMSRNLSLALIGAEAGTLVAWLAWGRSRQLTLLAIMGPALALGAVLVRSSGDYAAHTLFWERTLAGGDPWAIDSSDGFSAHAYGPLFNLLAIPFALHPLAPTVFYSLVWAATLAILACRDRWIALALAPLGLWSAAWGGHFDILVAICLSAALGNYRGGRDVSAGVWLGAIHRRCERASRASFGTDLSPSPESLVQNRGKVTLLGREIGLPQRDSC